MQDYDMYGIAYVDGDPLLGLLISIILITLFHVVSWIINKIKYKL
tara:strand:- start:4579 stop:4713 length:135 start_codon:yes stop_codon:yes gene_type:complete